MKSRVVTLLLALVAYVSTSSKHSPGSLDDRKDYITSYAYNQSKLQWVQDNHMPEYYGYKQPCPNADDIAPCVCKYYADEHAMDLDCSTVESEEQLRQIFKADFPFKNFRTFNLQHNSNLKVLESYVFNNISFERIEIYYNEFEVIEDHALYSCYETATVVDFYKNRITSFPFDALSNFVHLKEFGITSNSLSTIPAYAFHGITTLEIIWIQYITQNNVGTFQNLTNLKDIAMGGNSLTIIPTNFIKTGSTRLEIIRLQSNAIISVEPGAFDIVEGMHINMTSNSLSTLDEATWGPLLVGGVVLDAANNPLSCGCDIAWLFKEDQRFGQVSKDTTCSDGENIHNLDPSIFYSC
ncbi:unnamed protein product [Meganyctiphanes norvegica]|uniref:Oplophorus-luciferin 2-monooxygenase non-catalytic subunit n=1 Tax=Meganyctiphanes norvegica TaxID=48144 RepID=A0AAV2RZ78_MEGNR